ncbi:MAG: HipA domain-containing protein [Terrisporobacter othiniensis]|nr:HipA domain-containing protein [Terrisporobacter othiniensis]MDU6996741.1 HipA domain-containing protein [Terrisporobacter othiniensis]
MIKDFSCWVKNREYSEPSGKSRKEWIINKNTNEIGLFKWPKDYKTYEHCSEKLAYEIAEIIGIKCAKIDIGEYRNQVGCISYLINNIYKYEQLNHGLEYIISIRENYDDKECIDKNSGEFYNLELILEAVREYELEDDVLRMMIFDYIIGNTDRHEKNWATIVSGQETRFSPLYDNGSSLCAYESDEKILNNSNNREWYNSRLIGKSKSCIRIDKEDKKYPKHQEVMKYIKSNYYEQTIEFVSNISKKLDEDIIFKLINKYPESLISKHRKEFLIRYLNDKVNGLIEIYELK